MRFLVTAEEMRKMEQYTIETIGVPSEVLMERAALSVRDYLNLYLEKHSGLTKTALIAVGSGNNGGDGLALARILSEEEWKVDILLPVNTEHATAQWKKQKEILDLFDLNYLKDIPEKSYSVIIDGIFGVGLSREVEGKYAEYILRLNQMSGKKVSIDIPSGIDSTTGKVLGVAFRADETITFAFGKRGLYHYPGCLYAGHVRIADIGIPKWLTKVFQPEVYVLDEEPEKLLPKRDPCGNKGTFGKVLLIAGSKNMAGAAILAAKSAYKIGAGMVKILTVPENREVIHISIPEALLGTFDDVKDSIKWADTIAIGPGLGKDDDAVDILKAVIQESDLPLIIDADGLNILAQRHEIYNALHAACKNGRPVVVTPHPGELARLLHESIEAVKEKHLECAKMLAKGLGVIVVAKDARTMICNTHGTVCMNLTGNNGMATAGSGDVLTGMIAGLVAQGMDMEQAACVGVYYHGKCGDSVSGAIGEHACMAGDIINEM